jgi:MarR family transcriptional regulator, temperature-dependent positive regulator of motility
MLEIYAMPGYLTRRLHQVSVALFSDEMHKVDLDLTPVQFGALVATENEPGLDQATLANRISYDRATIGGVVDRLVQKEFIRREISTRDRRARELYLTKSGEATLSKARPAVANLQSILLSSLSSDEQKQFVRLLKKTTDDLQSS